MEKRLSYKYSFKWEKKVSIIASCFCFIIFIVISIGIFVYIPLKWHYGILFFAVAIVSLVDTIIHFKCKIVHYDLNFIYVGDYKEKKYSLTDLLLFKRFLFNYYILKINNEQGFVDKIYVYVNPYMLLCLTKEAKELIKLTKNAKVKNSLISSNKQTQ